MLATHVSMLILLIMLCSPVPSQDSVDSNFNILTGNGQQKEWIYDGSEKRPENPRQCETWTFNKNMQVRIQPCGGSPRYPTWRIFMEDNYTKVEVENIKYIFTHSKDTDSDTQLMELEIRPPTQGSRSVHKYFHEASSRRR